MFRLKYDRSGSFSDERPSLLVVVSLLLFHGFHSTQEPRRRRLSFDDFGGDATRIAGPSLLSVVRIGKEPDRLLTGIFANLIC
jgi:hypothetical protein